jgi:hypothetical protein
MMNKILFFFFNVMLYLSLITNAKSNVHRRTYISIHSAKLALKACDKVALTPYLTSTQPLITANPVTGSWVNTSYENGHFLYNGTNRLSLYATQVKTSIPKYTKATIVLKGTDKEVPGWVMNERGSVYQLLPHIDSVWIDAKNCGGQATVDTHGNFKNQYVTCL